MEFKSHVGYHRVASTCCFGSAYSGIIVYRQNIAITCVNECEGGCNLRDAIFFGVFAAFKGAARSVCIFYHTYIIILNNIQLIIIKAKKHKTETRFLLLLLL